MSPCVKLVLLFSNLNPIAHSNKSLTLLKKVIVLIRAEEVKPSLTRKNFLSIILQGIAIIMDCCYLLKHSKIFIYCFM